jgi:putative hydrolase of the HAD superfamily
MPQPTLDTLFLDAGGVLVFPNWTRVSEMLARHGIEVAPEALAAAEPQAKRELDVPPEMRSFTDASRGWVYFHLVLGHSGVPPSAATEAALAEVRDYHARHNLWENVPEDVVPSLERFRAKGLKLTVVSNSNGTLRTKLQLLELARFFEHVLDSHEEGLEKPDPRFFKLAMERAGARPEQTLYVGDTYQVDVVGARAAGIRAVLVDPAGLFADRDCRRFESLPQVAAAIESGELP